MSDTLEAKLIEHDGEVSYRLTNKRWLALFFACSILIGSYYCYDNPQALQNYLQQGNLDLSSTQYNLLYSVYSMPNIVLPLFGGFLIDKIGVRIGIFVFSLVLVVGQFVFMLGGSTELFWLMLLGRVVFGLGGECLCVAQSTIVSSWFGEKELAFALGLNISVSRLGSTFNSIITPKVYDSTNNYTWPLIIGMILCGYSWLCGLAIIWMDREADRREGKKQISEVDESEKIRLRDIKDFNLSFWILLVNCVLIYGGFFAFTGNANDLMVQMYGFSPDEAGNFITIIYIIAALITPLFGMFTDRFGKRADLMLVSLVLFIISNLLFAYLPADSSHSLILLPLILSGLFYSTYAAIFWPCVPLIVDKNKVGTAFGVITAFQNANLVVSPLLFGVIHDATPNDRNGYFWAELFIVLQAILGLYTAGFLNIIDHRTGSVLNSKRKPKMSKHSFHM